MTLHASTVSTPASFDTLDLAAPIQRALAAEGYVTPTPIQSQAIPPALDGRDLLGIAQTGTGKTAAFALPILHRLLALGAVHGTPSRGRAPRALVLAPTRELAAQIGDSFAAYGRNTPLRAAVIFGGVSQRPQVNALRSGVDIIVATPGRLTDLMQQREVNLGSIGFAVLDEADRMLDMGFIDPIRRIMASLPKQRQTMLFSATMPNEIRHLADSFLRDPVRVAVTPAATTVERIDQKLYHIAAASKTQLLVYLLAQDGVERTLVFTKTKHGADRVVKRLVVAGIEASAIHGNKAQNHRTRALDAFRSGRAPVLVATDIAARGIDVDGITHVVNFDLPMEPEAYVHRIGRTARAGASGIAISFCSPEERHLLRQVERLTRQQISTVATPTSLPALPPPITSPVGGNEQHRPHAPQQSRRGERSRGRAPFERHGNSPKTHRDSTRESAHPVAAAPSDPRTQRVANFAARSGRGQRQGSGGGGRRR